MPVEFLHVTDALKVFASETTHQGQAHIKPLHKYIALRLVLEGGFLPDEITPHPPIAATETSKGWRLKYAPNLAKEEELTVFGGMKTKKIDVVVSKPRIGPVVAVSVKGTFRAYRNLVNRMEEAIGDSTNVHVMYPGLVYGFLSAIRANREAGGYLRDDIGVYDNGIVKSQIRNYEAALMEMTGRRFVRNDYTRYEAIGLVMVENSSGRMGAISQDFPSAESPLRIESFFPTLFKAYDLRFPLRAARLPVTRRIGWLTDSPLFDEIGSGDNTRLNQVLGYSVRIAG